MISPRERRIIIISVLSRCATILLAAVISHWIDPFDTSSFVAYNNTPTAEYKSNFERVLRRSLIGFGNWDGIYFLRISAHDYEFDQYHAFFPLLPILIACLRVYILGPLLSAWLSQHTLTLLSAVIVSNSCFVLAAILLYKLSLKVLRSAPHAYWSAIFFCINPASIFMSAAYTESLFAAIAFGTLWAQERSGPLATVPFLVLASLTRSNGAPLIAVIGHSTLLKQLQSRPKTLTSVVAAFVVAGLLTLPAALSAWLPLFGFEHRARSLFCDGSRPSGLVPWCSSLPTGAALYGFIQKNYWNVGLFNYWELKQIPNFLIATPMIVLSAVAIIRYFKYGHNLASALTLGLLAGDASSRQRAADPYYDSNVSSYMLHWLFLLIFGVLVMYVQVLNRFLSSQCAPLYWFAASTLLQARGTKAILPKLVTGYFIVYCLIGTILFTAFYPWT